MSQKIQQGCFDTFDSLSYSVFGKTILPTNLQALLGVNGTAQVMAHELQKAVDSGSLDMDKLKQTIDEVTDERQSQIMRVDINRARYAAKEATALGEEWKHAMAGESLYTPTACASRQQRKIREAATSLAYAISGSEALHTLRSMLGKKIEEVSVEGFGSKQLIQEMAAKAGVKVTPSMIVHEGAGRYNLHLDAKKIAGLLKPGAEHEEGAGLLANIRTGEGMEKAIKTAQNPPGYTRTLDRAQAQGSLYLRAAGSGILGFAPGVGKTDTAIAAAMELMQSEPDKHHRVLIVAPPTALANAWAKTISQTCPGKTLHIFDKQDVGEGETWADAKTMPVKQRGARANAPEEGQPDQRADFTMISYAMLGGHPELVKGLGHTIIIADEAQFAKNPNAQRTQGLASAAGNEDDAKTLESVSGGIEHRWGLTGTILEKNMGEMQTQLNWAKPGHYGTRAGFQKRYDDLNKFDQLTGDEKVQQFRESVADGAFFQSPNMSSMPPFPELSWEDVKLSDGHKQAIQEASNEFTQAWHERRRLKAAGVPFEDQPKLPAFGGRDAQMAALMKPTARGYNGPNARATKIADMVEGQKETKWEGFKGSADHKDGDNAGTYAGKSVIFGQETQPLQPIMEEIKRRGGTKVFYTDSHVGKNQQTLKDFLAYKGKSVLITSDMNKTAVSLQFGDNSGKFQHGATQVIHADMPQNNADLQQRIARIWRSAARRSRLVWYPSAVPGSLPLVRFDLAI